MQIRLDQSQSDDWAQKIEFWKIKKRKENDEILCVLHSLFEWLIHIYSWFDVNLILSTKFNFSNEQVE